MRPTHSTLDDGRSIRWQYGEAKDVIETHTRDGAIVFTRTSSADGLTETTEAAGGPVYTLTKDAYGRPIALAVDGVAAAQMSWRRDGVLSSMQVGETEVQTLRNADGLPTGMVVSAPRSDGRTNQWLEEKWDLMGRPVEVTDSTGFKYSMAYDDSGRLDAFGRLTSEGKLLGTSIKRDGNGRVTEINSSWSVERRTYSDAGNLTEIALKRGPASTVMTLTASGRPLENVSFDGGVTSWVYGSEDENRRLRSVALPNGLRLDYLSHGGDGPALGEIRFGPALVQMGRDAEGRINSMAWGTSAP